MLALIVLTMVPLKFRAPGMSHALGMDIARLVFKALKFVEAALVVIFVGAMAKRTKALSATALNQPGTAPIKGKTGTLTQLASIGAEAIKVVTLPIVGIHIILAVAA